jgi:hypothetical protein
LPGDARRSPGDGNKRHLFQTLPRPRISISTASLF